MDVIISVGYRVKSQRGTQFRIWATNVLREFLLRGYTYRTQIQELEQRVDHKLIEQHDEIHEMKLVQIQQQKQLDFLVKTHTLPQEKLFATGCVWDAYTYVCDLVRTAKKRIVLIDNFTDDRVLKILDKREKGFEATIHTRYTEQFELDLAKHNEQYSPITKIQLPQKVHDRFLIIDKDVFLLGASVKDMGKGLCAITKVGFTPQQVLELLK